MSEILYADVPSFVASLKTPSGTGPLPPAILVFGDEMLYKSVLQTLLDVLIPPEKQDFGYEAVDGLPENVQSVMESLNTYSFFSGKKVVGFLDTRIFYASKNAEAILEKAREAHSAKELKTAARYFYSLLSVMGLCLEDVAGKNYAGLKMDRETLGDTAWLDSLVAYCAENPMARPSGDDPLKIFQQAIEKGFPEGHHLILTADMVDKRKGLYKVIAEKGLIVDCSVPKGENWADRQAQNAILQGQAGTILAQSGKTLDKAAFQKLVEVTGFDLRMFAGNLEKLVQVAGDRPAITAADIESALPRTRQDPVFELTNAVADRNFEAASFYLRSLLTRGFYPLQIIAAIVNQIRRLLILKDFQESPAGRVWQAGMTFDQFKQQFARTLQPALQAYDAVLTERIAEWEARLPAAADAEAPPPPSAADKKKKKPAAEKKAAAPSADLVLAKQPASPYPLFLSMQKAGRFSKSELIQAVMDLDAANLSLKSSSLNPVLVLERLILKICGASHPPQAARTAR